MSDKFKDVVHEPEFTEWPAAAGRNSAAAAALRQKIPNAGFDPRPLILAEAAEYTAELAATADKAGLPANIVCSPELLSSARGAASISYMAGHQPIIVHSGVFFKYLELSRAAKISGGSAINLIIDTDEGDGGAFSYPRGRDDGASVARAAIASGEGIYLFQVLKSAAEIRSAAAEAAGQIESGADGALAAKLRSALAMYEKLAGADLTAANTIVRRVFEKAPAYLDVPLSRLLRLSKVQAALRSLVPDPAKWRANFNQTLADFRKERGITNAANPFPDMKEGELPFWVLNLPAKTRVPLLENTGRPPAGANELIVPRAALITMFFRLYAADLFVHGTGGAKYDAFSDRFIERHYGATPPRFAVTSASRYLFDAERDEYEKAKELHLKKRDMLFHPEKYLAGGIFSSNDARELQNLVERKNQEIAKIKSGKAARESTAAFTQEIKRIEARIKELVTAAAGDGGEFKEPPKRVLDALYYREFPYFLFESAA